MAVATGIGAGLVAEAALTGVCEVAGDAFVELAGADFVIEVGFGAVAGKAVPAGEAAESAVVSIGVSAVDVVSTAAGTG